MPNYKVKHTSILHNGKVHAEGSTIVLTEEEAKRLYDFVELLPEQKQTETKTVKKETPKEAEIAANNTTETKTKKSVKAKTPEKNETENSSDTTKTEGDK